MRLEDNAFHVAGMMNCHDQQEAGTKMMMNDRKGLQETLRRMHARLMRRREGGEG